jgi:hypothetical protein
MMKPHPSRGWSLHTTHDHIIDVNGDDATLDVQFVVFEVRGKERPAAGWPGGASWAQGTVQPIEAGYYRPILRRVDGVWKITTMRITLKHSLCVPGPVRLRTHFASLLAVHLVPMALRLIVGCFICFLP